MSLTVYIDMAKYTKEYADSFLNLTALSVEALAVKKVRVRSGNLKNSIRNEQVGPYKWVVISQAPYAAAQEYGLGKLGKPKYGFTPYMRPAAIETENNMNALARQAEKIALNKSRVNKRYD